MSPLIYLSYIIVSVSLVLFVILILLNISYLYFVIRYRTLDKNNRTSSLSKKSDINWPSVSVLVPSYNESDSIVRVIRSLKEVDYPSDKLEIIFIDDSNDDTSSIIKKHMLELNNAILVKNKRRFGKPYALNLGAKIARGEIIIVFDADNYFSPNTIKELVLPFFKDKNIWAVQGAFYVDLQSRMTRVINIEYLMWQLPQSSEYPLLYGYNYAIRRDILNALGYWRVDVLSEDTDLAMRIYLNGGKIAYTKRASVQVLEPGASKELVLQRKRWLKGTIDVLKCYSSDPFFLFPPAKNSSHRIKNAMSLYSRGTIPSILSISLFGCALTYPFTWLSSLGTLLFLLFFTNAVIAFFNILITLKKYGNIRLIKDIVWVPIIGLLNIFALFKSLVDRKITWKRTEKIEYPEINLESFLYDSESYSPSLSSLAFDSILFHRISFR